MESNKLFNKSSSRTWILETLSWIENALSFLNSLLEQEDNSSVLPHLNGEGQFPWNPTQDGSPILQQLMGFREINIAGAKKFKVLNDIRVLSLSYISVFGHTSLDQPRLCEYLNIKDCSKYCQQVDIPTVENIQEVIANLLKPQSAYTNSLHNLDQFKFTISGITGLSHAIITNTYNCLLQWNDSDMTECQFSEQCVFSLLLPLFVGCRDFEISKYDKTMIKMTDYKPDLLVLLKSKFGAKMYFFVHREMKAVINQQVDLSLSNPLCYAVLVEGYDCYIYKMSLEYEAEYRSFLISQFRILRDALDVMLLVPVINTLSYLHEE